jgi:4'-phosphopantetheinyl transferase
MSAAFLQLPKVPAEHLPDDEVHVWQLPYRRSLGRKPLCALLGRYLGLPGERVVLVDGAHGRPELGAGHDRALAFNWSHSGTEALIAVARGVLPGVDLEQLRERPKALALARRFFTADEAQALAAEPEPARSAAFLRMWTAKEAVLKADGRGIGFGLHRLRVAALEARLALQWMDGNDAAAWQLQTLDVGPGYLAALAWRGDGRRVRMRRLAVDTHDGGVHFDLA